jgi:hypothetical protein
MLTLLPCTTVWTSRLAVFKVEAIWVFSAALSSRALGTLPFLETTLIWPFIPACTSQ